MPRSLVQLSDNVKKWARVASRILIGLVALCCVLPARAFENRQTATSAGSGLHFEVATIKVHNANAPSLQGVQIDPGGRVHIVGVDFKTLARIALNCPFWAISGGDAAIEKVNYDVEAVPPESLRASITDLRHTWYTIDDPRLRQMLTALLIDRFHLQFHRETKIRTVYLLERNGKVLRLVRSEDERRDDKGELINPGSGSIGLAGSWAVDASMKQLANFASDFILHAPVQDETHLEGYFHYRSPVTIDMSDPDASGTSFMSFISELGLRLKKSQGPVETIVIDHVERPSEN